MLNPKNIQKLADWTMPFGKYRGHTLIDLPEEYLLWFDKKGFPEGELGALMQLALSMRIDGLEDVIRPLKSKK
ncbi:MAG: DUF3820 family protein [Arenicellaceae bacterium]|nr:DUF3820 family protein [Arenicellaceae bacterium]